MKDALGKNEAHVGAGPDAPGGATCPACGGIVDLRSRRTGKNPDHKTWFYRHRPGEGRDCPRRPGTSVAYVRISAFSQGATDELKDTLDGIQEEGLSAVLLDLRSNPGGLLNEAVGVTSHFVDSGNVLLRRDAEGDITEEPVRQRAVDIRLMALANQGPVSAAEIVIGALQDHTRATIVGTTTFGAGTVLNEFTLSDGSLLLLAVEEWLTPDGRVIWQKGLAPDVEVALAPDAEPLSRLGLQDITEEELRNSQHAQLLRPLQLLKTSTSDEDG